MAQKCAGLQAPTGMAVQQRWCSLASCFLPVCQQMGSLTMVAPAMATSQPPMAASAIQRQQAGLCVA